MGSREYFTNLIIFFGDLVDIVRNSPLDALSQEYINARLNVCRNINGIYLMMLICDMDILE